jgi:pSer/pThr/pTyr-binding forkhead associated (FHA) protein
LLNDHPVTQSTRLSDGDTIQIGPAIFVFRVRDILATTETAAGASPS